MCAILDEQKSAPGKLFSKPAEAALSESEIVDHQQMARIATPQTDERRETDFEATLDRVELHPDTSIERRLHLDTTMKGRHPYWRVRDGPDCTTSVIEGCATRSVQTRKLRQL